jgi:NhaA family Na+:H+ antiporter
LLTIRPILALFGIEDFRTPSLQKKAYMIQTKPLPIDRIMGPFLRFARLEASGGILLLFATVAALVWANSPWEASYYTLLHTPVSVGFG